MISFERGEDLYREGELADSIWVLISGRVQVFKQTTEAKPFAIETLGPGELVGTLCRLGENNRTYPCTATAAEPTTVVRMPDLQFLAYYSVPGFARGLCALCSTRLRDVQSLRALGQEKLPVRIASTLLRLYGVHGEHIPFTKRELSELIAASLEATFRALAEFEAAGIVASTRGKILVRDPERLKGLVGN